MIDSTKYHGDMRAFKCYEDSMERIGFYDGDIAIVRIQETISSSELAIVTVNGDEGNLKRVRFQKDAIILEAANFNYPPRVFMGEDMNLIHIVGKVIGTRRMWQ